MAIGALCQDLLINNDRLALHQAGLDVALVASHSGVTSLQRQMRPCVVIEGGGNPPLFVVAIGARRFAGFSELARMSVLVAIRANLRCTFELDILLTHRDRVTGTAPDNPMCAKQRKLRFRMIESVDVDP